MANAISQKTVIIYDGQCHFCLDQIKRIKGWDRDNQFEYLPRQAPEADLRFPVLRAVDFEKGMRLIEPNGQAYAGADAVYHIARRLPATQAIAWMYNIPGINQIAKALYAWVAANRQRWGQTCPENGCSVHQPPGPQHPG